MNKLQEIHDQLPPQVRGTLDVMAIIGWLSALSDLLTPIVGLVAAIASCAWAIIRLCETKTVQRLLGRKVRTRASDSE